VLVSSSGKDIFIASGDKQNMVRVIKNVLDSEIFGFQPIDNRHIVVITG
jgi:hypothetical protein